MFTIITPTFERSEKLRRAIESVKTQDYKDWELIVVNDSPSDESYVELERNLDDLPAQTGDRIKYLMNEKNYGVNFSRNRALDIASHNWIIFLDDDDYLAPNALFEIKKIIDEHPNEKWVVTSRAHDTGRPITIFPKDSAIYNYAWDYLISKKLKGDATHAIKRSLIDKTRFSRHIKNGEEWLFFYEIGTKSKMLYRNIVTTLSEGYHDSGLNLRKRNLWKEFKLLFVFVIEGIERKTIFYPFYILYLFLRLIRLLIK